MSSSFLVWLVNNRGAELISMSDEEKSECVSAFLKDDNLTEIIVQGFREYMIADHHWANALTMTDAAAGADIKNCTYAMFECEILDAIEAYERYLLGTEWLSPVFEAII